MTKYKSIHFKHTVTVYIPCYIKYPDSEDENGPTFQYSYADGSCDQQLVASLNPDYILELSGVFDAKTQPYDLEILKYNKVLR